MKAQKDDYYDRPKGCERVFVITGFIFLLIFALLVSCIKTREWSGCWECDVKKVHRQEANPTIAVAYLRFEFCLTDSCVIIHDEQEAIEWGEHNSYSGEDATGEFVQTAKCHKIICW